MNRYVFSGAAFYASKDIISCLLYMYISLVSSGAERENMKPKQSNFNWKFTRIVVGKVLAWGTLFVGINENSIVWKQISKGIKVLRYFVLLELQWIKTSIIFFLSNPKWRIFQQLQNNWMEGTLFNWAFHSYSVLQFMFSKFPEKF